MSKTEKERREYYQNIVYKICNLLDRAIGKTVVCGTADMPSTEVQDTLKELLKRESSPPQSGGSAAMSRIAQRRPGKSRLVYDKATKSVRIKGQRGEDKGEAHITITDG